jgi:ABC-type molybdenum transport system ATPase subunit/photorepair protein PhrA
MTDMITEKDIQKIEDSLEKNFRKIFATKDELKATESYLEYKIGTVSAELKEFKEEMYKFRDSVLTTLDWLVGAFQKFEQEYLISNVQYKRTSEILDQHDKRLLICQDKLNSK